MLQSTGQQRHKKLNSVKKKIKMDESNWSSIWNWSGQKQKLSHKLSIQMVVRWLAAAADLFKGRGNRKKSESGEFETTSSALTLAQPPAEVLLVFSYVSNALFAVQKEEFLTACFARPCSDRPNGAYPMHEIHAAHTLQLQKVKIVVEFYHSKQNTFVQSLQKLF